MKIITFIINLKSVFFMHKFLNNETNNVFFDICKMHIRLYGRIYPDIFFFIFEYIRIYPDICPTLQYNTSETKRENHQCCKFNPIVFSKFNQHNFITSHRYQTFKQ